MTLPNVVHIPVVSGYSQLRPSLKADWWLTFGSIVKNAPWSGRFGKRLHGLPFLTTVAEAGLREFTVTTCVERTYSERGGEAVGLGSGETLVLSSHFRGQPTRKRVMLCTNAPSSTSADQFSVSSASTLTSVSDRVSGAAAAKTVSSCLLSR
jgi:hypothetical protein